ncbi:hypothetical protein LYNGBM3L_22320 [Moorena producens 3L]|uniref:Uncharacterized protein n=1 Tax=Moorena producens 3L TaxID=489825 RepID=F4XMK9_9CYAN|nr:hypothetical protein LYNGBM3L_22320 [Moorena producens 3L]
MLMLTAAQEPTKGNKLPLELVTMGMVAQIVAEGFDHHGLTRLSVDS